MFDNVAVKSSHAHNEENGQQHDTLRIFHAVTAHVIEWKLKHLLQLIISHPDPTLARSRVRLMFWFAVLVLYLHGGVGVMSQLVSDENNWNWSRDKHAVTFLNSDSPTMSFNCLCDKCLSCNNNFKGCILMKVFKKVYGVYSEHLHMSADHARPVLSYLSREEIKNPLILWNKMILRGVYCKLK